MGTGEHWGGQSRGQPTRVDDATDLRRLAAFVRERRQAIAASGRATDAADQLLHKMECVLLQLPRVAPNGVPETCP